MFDQIGIIVPFAGPLGMVPKGWLPCDGRPMRSLTHKPLWDVIGTAFGGGYWPAGQGGIARGDGYDFNLPDLRGQFVRGVETPSADGSYPGIDPEASSRTWLYRGGAVGRDVGTCQVDSTRLPNAKFTTNQRGNHNGHWAGNTGESPMGTGPRGASVHVHNAVGPEEQGNHAHDVASGGDQETRPKNVALLWIIRVEQ